MTFRIFRVWIARHAAAITLSGCTLAIITLQAPFLRKAFELDELCTLRLAISSWPSFWHYLRLDNTPPLFYLLAWLWVRLVPLHPLAIRILPVAFGVGTVYAAYWALRPAFGQRTALFSSILFAFMPAVTDVNGTFRAYSMTAALTLLYLGFWFRWAQRPSRKLFVVATLFGVLIVLTHVQAILAVAAVVLGSLVSSDMRKRWRLLLFHTASAAVVLIVWLFFFSGYFHVPQVGDAWYSNLHEQWLTQVLHLAFPFSGLSAFTPQIFSAIAILSTVTLLILGVRRSVHEAFRKQQVPAAILLLLSFFYVLVPAALHMTVTRYLLVSCLALYALCAIGLSRIKLVFSSTICALLLFAWVVNLWPAQHARVLEPFREFYREEYRPGDLILVHPFGEAWPLKMTLPKGVSVEGVFPARYHTNDPFEDVLLYNYRRVINTNSAEDLATLTAQAQRVWYQGPQPGIGDFFGSDLIFQWFREHGWTKSVAAQSKSNYILITLFVRDQTSKTHPATPWMDALQAPLDARGIRE